MPISLKIGFVMARKHSMKFFTTHFLFIMLAAMLSHSAVANTIELKSGVKQTTLLELYTSEGCSSCPPAEHWLNSLKDDPRLWHELIPVAFHVDYWDYLGWKDPFASPDNSARQRRYRQEGGVNTVYTPGFFSNGKEWRRWFGLKKLKPSNKTPGVLQASISNGVVKTLFDSPAALNSTLKLNIAILGFDLETKVRAGENRGKTLKHDFVVLGQASQNSSNGQWNMALPKASSLASSRIGIAIWVSEKNTQKPIQSIGGWL